MINTYYPGDTVFLYTAFQPGLNLINSRDAALERETGSLKGTNTTIQNGVYINGQYVSYDEYMYTYASDYSYLVDTTPYDTYYVYNSYYFSNALGIYYDYYHYHWYITTESNKVLDFPDKSSDSPTTNISDDDTPSSQPDVDIAESLNSADIIEVISHSIDVRILHDDDGEIFEDLEWTPMQRMNNNEFFYNFCIPYDFDSRQYNVVYRSIYSVKYFNNKTKQRLTDEELKNIGFTKRNKQKIMYARESFHVVAKRDEYEFAIKIFGIVNYQYSTLPAEDVRISIYETDLNTNKEYKVYQALTDRDGSWEAYVYPGQYRICFHRLGYIDENVYTEINNESSQQPFETISLGNGSSTQGTGIFKVFDNYHTKTGQPIYGLTVQAFSISDPNTVVATDVTNDKGFWELHLNDGIYLLKVTGLFNGIDFSRKFRLKVLSDGRWFFEGLNNILTDDNINDIGRGSGTFKIKDILKDRFGNPISEVQINIFSSNTTDLSDESIIAQDYSNGSGEYIVYLNPGTYIFEYYHPNYTTYTEIKTVSTDGEIFTHEANTSSSSNRTISDPTKYNNYTELANAINNGTIANMQIISTGETTSVQQSSTTSHSYSNSLYNMYTNSLRIR